MTSQTHSASIDVAIARATAAVRRAREHGGAVFVTAGAGMGVDSGLPDFRGPEGFWNAYPPYRHLGLDFTDLANPRWFKDDAAFAWGFYGHRLHLYRSTAPHEGYGLLKALCDDVGTYAVLTSNVDGAFVKAGFHDDSVLTIHGDIHRLQCTRAAHECWSANDIDVEVDPATFRAHGVLPTCPTCGAVARPNILMFGDDHFDSGPTDVAEGRFSEFVAGLDVDAPHVIIECGAGTAIPSVRRAGEGLLRHFTNSQLVRINVREAHVDDARLADRVIGISSGAKAALVQLAVGW